MKRKKQLYTAGMIALLCLCEWFFFRKMYGSSLLFGDTGDGRLTMLITEHWYHVFQGRAGVTDLGIFYPAANTLGDSDMLLGFGLVHSVLRLFGLDMYLAYKYTILLVHALGTFSCMWLLKRVLGVKDIWALFGTIAFSFSDSCMTGLLHPQLAAIGFLPLFAVCVVRFFQKLNGRKKRNLYAVGAILLIELVLYTSWYIAFFSALFAGICLVIWLLCGIGKNGYVRKQVPLFFRTVRFDLLGYIIAAAALAIPFILLEVPISRMSGGRTYEEFAGTMIPTFMGIIHVSGENVLLGKWLQSVEGLRGASHEVIRGFSVVLLALFAAGLVRTAVQLRGKPEDDRAEKNRAAQVLCGVIAAAVLVNVLLSVRWNEQGLSGWKLVYKLVPGGKSIRAVGRIFLFLNLPMAVITACIWSREGSGSPGRPWIRYGFAVLCLVMVFVSNLNSAGTYAFWDRDSAEARMAKISAPPEDCETFYIYNTGTTPAGVPFAQTDAYEIADRFGINTINGYSGINPPDWGGIWPIDEGGYRQAADEWITKYGLVHVYGYDAGNNTWVSHVTE